MNCQHVQTLLGRLHDGELAADERTTVEAHVRNCPVCQSTLTAIRELSELTAALDDPEPPGNLWDRLRERVKKDRPSRKARLGIMLRSRWAAAAAATLFVAAVGGWAISNHYSRPPLAQMVNEGDPLLDDLLAIRTGSPVTLQEAAQRVDFQLLTAANLPDGCCFGQCSLCKSGYCDLVQCQLLCRGERMLLVQSSPDHPVRYGNRTVLETQINGQLARVVKCEGCLACSWQTKGTALTLVGPRDLAELVQLVAYVDRHLGEKP
jgi:hypothetical protein